MTPKQKRIKQMGSMDIKKTFCQQYANGGCLKCPIHKVCLMFSSYDRTIAVIKLIADKKMQRLVNQKFKMPEEAK